MTGVVDRKNGYEFKTFEKVLVRNSDDEKWNSAIFSHCYGKDDKERISYVTISAFHYKQCIPYKGNESLKGTTNKPKED